MLSDAEYRTYVTGAPSGLVYAVDNPETGDRFDFSGAAHGKLLFTIASLHGAVQPDGCCQTARSARTSGWPPCS